MTKQRDDGVHQPDDKILKALLQSKKAFLQLLRYFISEDWTQHIEEHSLVRVDKSFILQDFAGKEADILYRCRLADQDVGFYVLLELQSTVDQQMPWRLLQYMVEIWRSMLKEETDAAKRVRGFRLPAIIPVVLYNGKPAWTAKRSFLEYQNNHSIFEKWLLSFHYLLVDIKRWDEKKLNALHGVLPLALQLERANDVDDLLERLGASIGTLSELSESETGLIQAYIQRILTPMADEESKEAIGILASQLAGGSDMISNAAEIIRKEVAKAQQRGMKAGIQAGQKRIVVAMQQKGMSFKEISETTQLSEDEIQELLQSQQPLKLEESENNYVKRKTTN